MDDTDLSKLIDRINGLRETWGLNLHEVRHVLECANSLWTLCPFRVGDRVRLTRTPEISDTVSWGWMRGKHFLVEGAVACVAARQFYEGVFRLGLQFEKETSKHYRTGELTAVDKPGLYFFGADWLAAVTVP